MSFEKDFQYERFQSLGREFSKKHKDFQFLSHLGNQHSRKRAALAFYFWLKGNSKATIEDKLKKAVELLGEAEFLTLTKAWERMIVSLGDTTPRRKWK